MSSLMEKWLIHILKRHGISNFFTAYLITTSIYEHNPILGIGGIMAPNLTAGVSMF